MSRYKRSWRGGSQQLQMFNAIIRFVQGIRVELSQRLYLRPSPGPAPPAFLLPRGVPVSATVRTHASNLILLITPLLMTVTNAQSWRANATVTTVSLLFSSRRGNSFHMCGAWVPPALLPSCTHAQYRTRFTFLSLPPSLLPPLSSVTNSTLSASYWMVICNYLCNFSSKLTRKTEFFTWRIINRKNNNRNY